MIMRGNATIKKSMTTRHALLPVALALALSNSPSAYAGAFTFNDGNFTNYTWTAAKIQDTTAGQTAGFSTGEVPAGAYNGGPYRTNAYTFSYNGTATNQGIIIGNISSQTAYSPDVSGAIDAITGFGIAGVSSASGGAPAISIGLLLMQTNLALHTNIYYTNSSYSPAGLGNQFKDQTPKLAADFTRIGSSGPMNPDFTTNGGTIEFGYFTTASLSSGISPAAITGTIGADYFALSISNTPSAPWFTSQQAANATNLTVTLTGLFLGESITWLVSTNLTNPAGWTTNSTSAAPGTSGVFTVTNSAFPTAPIWFLRAQVQ